MTSAPQDTCVVIPARYTSSRFPGKPLVPLLGKPMILWVAEACEAAIGTEHVVVATQDERIGEVVSGAGFRVLLTSNHARTGTDRILEASAQLSDYDILINVQGDEPMVNPADILQCARLKAEHSQSVINAWTYIGPDEDPANPNIPKVVMARSNQLIYMSRLPIPGHKDPGQAASNHKKQVCIYGYSHDDLKLFGSVDHKPPLEQCEDIEILRFLELGRPVRMFEAQGGSLAVDTPEDVAVVEAALRARR